MSKLIFATSNRNKVIEIQALLGEGYQVLSLSDIGFEGNLEEAFDTLEENAQSKAEQLYNNIGTDCFAEDSGLFVSALNGEPGVRSARYSGEQANDDSNIRLLLQKLENETNRRAYFKTVIHLISNKRHFQFSGLCHGVILRAPKGENGFGYDPIFVPDDIPNKSFAELSREEKNSISHRAKATQKFIEHLLSNAL